MSADPPPRPRHSDQLARLADRLEDTALHGAKPGHVAIIVQRAAIQMGRILDELRGAEALAEDQLWKHVEREGEGPKAEAEYFLVVAMFAISHWLVPAYPSRFQHGAAEWDWAIWARDARGRILDKQGHPLRYRWFRAGKPLSAKQRPRDGDRLTRVNPPAYVHEKFDAADRLTYQKQRACVYADACRILADLVAPSDCGSDQPDASGYVARPLDWGAYAPLSEIQRDYTPQELNWDVREVTRRVDDFATNGIRWTRPLSRGKPNSQRRDVHLRDWKKHVSLHRPRRHNDPTLKEIEEAKRPMRTRPMVPE